MDFLLCYLIVNKTQRIAYQIYETFGDDEELVIAGISKNGFILAENILKKLSEIMSTKITICEVFVDKQNPLNPVIWRVFLFAQIADFGNNFQKKGVKFGVSKFFWKKGHLIFWEF